MSEVHYLVNLDKLFVAPIIKDDATGVEYGEWKYLPGLKELGIKPKINSAKGYAEGRLWDQEDRLQEVELDVNIVDFTAEDECFVFGHKMAEDGGIIYAEDDKAPELAIGFSSTKANNKQRFQIYYKCVFSKADQSYKGREGKTDMQFKKAKITAIPLRYNGRYKYKVDEENGFTEDKFFKTVIMPKEKTENKSKEPNNSPTELSH